VSHDEWSFEMLLMDSWEYDWIRLGSYVSLPKEEVLMADHEEEFSRDMPISCLALVLGM
jgi:hypothetical protein